MTEQERQDMEAWSQSRRDRGAALETEVVRLRANVERLRAVLLEVNHTLCIHGHIDQETPLHERVHLAIAETKPLWMAHEP